MSPAIQTVVQTISCATAFNPIKNGPFQDCSLKSVTSYNYPTIIKFGTVTPYPEKIQKANETPLETSRETPLKICSYQHFFNGYW